MCRKKKENKIKNFFFLKHKKSFKMFPISIVLKNKNERKKISIKSQQLLQKKKKNSIVLNELLNGMK